MITVRFGLTYFTHAIDGRTCGGWYRLVPPNEIEVIGLGCMETARCDGPEPEALARSMLEGFARKRSGMTQHDPAAESEVHGPYGPLTDDVHAGTQVLESQLPGTDGLSRISP